MKRLLVALALSCLTTAVVLVISRPVEANGNPPGRFYIYSMVVIPSGWYQMPPQITGYGDGVVAHFQQQAYHYSDSTFDYALVLTPTSPMSSSVPLTVSVCTQLQLWNAPCCGSSCTQCVSGCGFAKTARGVIYHRSSSGNKFDDWGDRKFWYIPLWDCRLGNPSLTIVTQCYTAVETVANDDWPRGYGIRVNGWGISYTQQVYIFISAGGGNIVQYPPPTLTQYYQPIQQGALEFDAPFYARWVISDTDALVYAPTAGIVERVDQENYLVRISSTQIGEYWVSNVRAPENLAGVAIPAGCAMGFYNQPGGGVFSPTISVATDRALTPSVGAYLTMIPDGGPCTESWKCYTQVRRGAVSGILNEPEVTITLPARLWPGFDYYLDFSSRVISGAISFRFSNPRGETYAVVEICKPPPSNSGVWGPGILQLILPDKADYVVSPTTFAEGDNRLWWKLNPTGAADLHQVCIMGISGGELVGVCPPPGDNQWNLGDGATWEIKKARLTDGGWIWKEATIFLPPSPSAAGLPWAAGVSSTEVDVAAISGKYEARVLVEPLQGSPTLYFEKELAPGVWKTLDVISVTRRAYYNLVTQFDTGQQYLTIRLRASGGELRIHEVCSEEEQRESEIVAPCFGIEPYNSPPLTCNLLECPVEQVKYQMQKLHDVALLPPLCKIAYWINNMYYHALTTVGKPILQYLTTIQELIRQYGFVKGIVEALEVLLRSLWISLIKPYGTLLVNWLWGVLQPVLDFLGVSEYTLKLLQRFFYLLYTLFRKAFVILANGTVGLVKAAWLGFKQGLTATPTTPPVPPESIQLGMELIGYSVGNVLIIPLIVIFTGIMMWQFFFWSLKVLGIVK